jgi:hypothetical protein
MVFRPYQILKKYETAPTLPIGFPDLADIYMVPSLWFMIMDPRVKAIEDTKKGIPNPDQWNDRQPLSEADKKRHLIMWVYLVIHYFVYLYFFANAYQDSFPFR